MALKCIAFTDGTKLCLFAKDTTIWDDTFTISPNEVQNYSQTNAFITAGNPSGGFVNEILNGKSLTDGDGNTWVFVKSSTSQFRVYISQPSGKVVSFYLERAYSGDTCYFHALICTEVTSDGKYGISVGTRRSTLPSTRQTTGSTKYLRMGYHDGVNGKYNFADDAAMINPADGWTNSQLRNIITGGSPFVNIVGLSSGYTSDEIKTVTAWSYYGMPYTAGSLGQPFIYLSENAIKDYVETPPDPYDQGGDSGTGGGTGNFDGASEDINIPNLPTLSAVDTGFISLFNPTAGELKNLANYLWGDVFDISTWKKIFADPMDAILGLSIVPVNVPSSGSSPVTIGNISTGVSMTKASSQYVSVDCGTINVHEYWGAYLDYSPYTQAEIYLPFIGIHPLTIDDIMGKPVHVVYHIDILSGACCAYVKCGGSVLYSFVGQCSCSIPITANDWTNVINGALSIAGAIGSMVASGGATAPMAISNMASTAVNSLKPSVEKSGSMGGMGGMLGVQKPYIILTRPKQALPARQNTFTGYPSYITKKLSSCSGYTEVESIHLENVPATDNELSEITDLLKSGVII